jgi:hypothetical protein
MEDNTLTDELLKDEELVAHPFTNFDALAHRQKTAARLARQCKKRGVKFEITEQGVVMKVFEEGVSDLVRSQIRADHPHWSDAQLKKSFDQLVGEVKKFDWRTLGVTPFVKDQGLEQQTCWAYAATAAFESSLMIQRAKAGLTRKQGSGSANINIGSTEQEMADQLRQLKRVSEQEKVLVDVISTIAFVKSRVGDALDLPDWHQNAFRYFLSPGAPLSAIRLGPAAENSNADISPRDASYEDASVRRVKAVAWDYIHDPEKQRPNEIPPTRDLKIALLEHGPLVVGMVLDERFGNWGKPEGEPAQHQPDSAGGAFEASPVFEGNATKELPDHVVLLLGWDEDKQAWIIQNSYGRSWGYTCDAPRVTKDGALGTDCGFAYVKYGNNDIGSFAAYVEADLLTDEEDREVRSLTERWLGKINTLTASATEKAFGFTRIVVKEAEIQSFT